MSTKRGDIQSRCLLRDVDSTRETHKRPMFSGFSRVLPGAENGAPASRRAFSALWQFLKALFPPSPVQFDQ